MRSHTTFSDRTRRIAFIKHLARAAEDDLSLPEPLYGRALLEIHDAVEMFLSLVAEQYGAALTKKQDFMEYWTLLAPHIALPQQPRMKRLNQARVGLKHSGVIPVREEVSDLTVNAVRFLDEVSELAFALPLEDVSMAALVPFEPAASLIREAEKRLRAGEIIHASDLCGYAFDELIRIFTIVEESTPWKPAFPAVNRVSSRRWSIAGQRRSTHVSAGSVNHKLDETSWKELERHLEDVQEAFGEIESTLHVLALGIDYRQYAELRKSIPALSAMGDGSKTFKRSENKGLTSDQVRRALEVVTEMGIRIAEGRRHAVRPSAGLAHPFGSKEVFRVAVAKRSRSRGASQVQELSGHLISIGGVWEAWISVDGRLQRVFRGDSEQRAEAYLQQRRAERGATAGTPGVPKVK